MRGRGDDGVAAVEMALVSTLLLLIGFGALPVYGMARAYQSVDHTSASALRYATAVAASGKRQADGTFRRRPTAAEVTAFAKDAANDNNLTVTVSVCPSATPAVCALGDPSAANSGDVIVVKVAKDVDLSLLGSVANAIGSLVGSGDIAPHGVVTLTSTATGRQE